MDKLKLAGVVILLEPPQNLFKNINSYSEQIDKLYCYDNSSKINSELRDYCKGNKKLEYIFNSDNLGIATVLNMGALKSIYEGYDFLLTMDQDTFVDKYLVKKYKDYIASNSISDIGMFVPVPFYNILEINKPAEIKEVDVAITSGSLINLEAYKKVCPFCDKLFIDYVDYEYCLRLRKNNFKIIQLNSAVIYHQLGNTEKRKFLLKDIYVTHHSPLRYYYRTRNRLYVAIKYFKYFRFFVIKDFFVFLNELIKIFLYESCKMKKIRMIIRGVTDFIRNKYGNYDSLHNKYPNDN